MGIISATVELSNPKQPQLSPLNVSALVDTGAMTICIPEHVAVQLQLTEIEQREVTMADERSRVVPYVGPIQIRFQNRTCFTGAWCWATRCFWAPSRWKTWTWSFRHLARPSR